MSKNQTILSFLKRATIYEVNTRQFSEKGDFNSVQNEIPRLQKMGVDVLWFMPIHPIGIKNRKGSLGSYYSIKDYYDINPEFGTKEDFKNLVKAAHSHGMKVIIDWVANHAAWDNKWVDTNPEFFLINDNGDMVSPHDWSDVAQINHSNEKAHEALQNAMLYWVREFDIDGFRADLAHLTPLHFWIKAKHLTELIKPNLIWLAETKDRDYYNAFDVIYAWKWMHQTEELSRNHIPVSMLIDLLKAEHPSFPSGTLQLYFTSNHDENSWNGTEYEKYGVNANALAVFSFTYPGSVPLIYSGQEIPNEKRLQFFEKDPIDWNKETRLDSFYHTLSHLRKNITAWDTLEFVASNPFVLGFKRGQGESCIIVLLNLGKEKTIFITEKENWVGDYTDVFRGNTITVGLNTEILLGPGGYLLLEKIKT